MQEGFYENNNIDFNKLNIDPLVANKIKKYMQMASDCHEIAIKKLKNNDSFLSDFDNEFLNFCDTEKINISMEDARNNFSSFLLALATELNLKSIYILSEYETLLEKHKKEGQNKPFCEYCFSETRFDQSGLDELKQSLGATTKSFGKYPIPNTNNELPGKNNGHYLYALLHNISNQAIRDLIKYEVIVAPLKNYFLDENYPNLNKYIQAPEVISLFREFTYDKTVQTINNNMLTNSDSLENQRYFDKIATNEDTRSLISFDLSTHIVLCDLLRKKTYQEEDLNNYIQRLDDNNPVRQLHENIYNYNESEDSECFEKIKEMKQKNPLNYYILISKFNEEEIKRIIKNYNETNSQINVNFEDFLNHYIFFKLYIEEVILTYDESKIKNISKLFKTIKETKDISQLGNQFNFWFKSIDIKSLTEEEFEILDVVDPKYIYNNLDYQNKIIYNKCKLKNIKFSFSYSVMTDANSFFKNKITKNEIVECEKISKNLGIPFNELVIFYENLTLEEIKEYKRISEEKHISFYVVARYYKELGGPAFDECEYIAINTGCYIGDIICFYKDLSKGEINHCYRIAKRTHSSFYEVAFYYKKLESDEIKSLLKKSIETNQNFAKTVIDYKKLSKEEIYVHLMTIRGMKDKANFYKFNWNLSSDERSIFHKELNNIYRKTGISYEEIFNSGLLENKNKEQIIKLLSETNYDSNMQILKLSSILRNVELLNKVSPHIFYKTPSEIEQIKQMCIENEVSFNNNLLYFEMEDLKENVKALSMILNIKEKDMTINDVGILLKSAREISKFAPSKIAYEEKEERKIK